MLPPTTTLEKKRGHKKAISAMTAVMESFTIHPQVDDPILQPQFKRGNSLPVS